MTKQETDLAATRTQSDARHGTSVDRKPFSRSVPDTRCAVLPRKAQIKTKMHRYARDGLFPDRFIPPSKISAVSRAVGSEVESGPPAVLAGSIQKCRSTAGGAISIDNNVKHAMTRTMEF